MAVSGSALLAYFFALASGFNRSRAALAVAVNLAGLWLLL
jgi:hypothetical protein